MLDCRKSSPDALLGLFLRSKRANILIHPRQRLDLGTVFVVRGRSVEGLPPEELLDGPVTLRPVDRGDAIDEVLETVSDRFSSEVGGKLTGAILQALGLSGAPDIGASLKASRAASHTVALSQLQVNALHRASLAVSLQTRQFRTEHPYADGNSSYYIATATWAATRIVLRSFDEGGGGIDLDAQALDALSGSGRLEARRGTNAETYLSSKVPLVFGVETMRIGRKDQGLILIDRQPGVSLRGEDDGAAGELRLIDDQEDASAFLDLSASGAAAG